MQISKLYHVMCEDMETKFKNVLHTYTQESQAQAYIQKQLADDLDKDWVNTTRYWIETDNIIVTGMDKFDSIFNNHEMKGNSK